MIESDLCNVCGKNLISTNSSTEQKELECYFCKTTSIPKIYCPNGHYVCDSCHSKKGIVITTDFCTTTKETNPYIIANTIMNHPKFNMAGPEHHTLSPAILLTMLKNLKIPNQNGKQVTNQDILEGIKRLKKVPGGWCGFNGTCGAAVGSGVAIALFTESAPSRNLERTYSMKTTSDALGKIADNIEHCCKRSIFYSIASGLQTLREITNETLNFEPESCAFSGRNPKCEFDKCPFFNQTL